MKGLGYLVAEHIHYHSLEVHSAMKTAEMIKPKPLSTIRWGELHPSQWPDTTHCSARDTASLQTGLSFHVLNATQDYTPQGHQ